VVADVRRAGEPVEHRDSPTTESCRRQPVTRLLAPTIASRSSERSTTAPAESDTLGPTVESVTVTPSSM
jgi:hypothetical protein